MADESDYATKQTENQLAANKDLPAPMQSIASLQACLREQAELAKQFRSGIATPQLTKARAYPQALHMSNDDIDTALSSAQQFNKLSFQQMLQNAKKFDGSRPAMQIMPKTFELATQNESLSPQTNHKLIGDSPGAADYAQKYNEDWLAAQSKGWQNEDKFRTDWEKVNNLDDFRKPPGGALATSRASGSPILAA
jgi:hypothetical protein